MKAYRQNILPALQYMFHGTYHSKQFLLQQSDINSTQLLPRLGFNRNTPIAIRYATHNLLGINLPNLYCEYGIIILRELIQHVRERPEN